MWREALPGVRGTGARTAPAVVRGAGEEAMSTPNPVAVVQLPLTCEQHGVTLRFTRAQASVVDGVLTVMVNAEPHRGEDGYCCRSFGAAVAVER